MRFKEILSEIWADAIIITLVVIAILIVAGAIKAQSSTAVMRTGFKVDRTSTTDTITFQSTPGGTAFVAKSLWIYLDKNAVGSAVIRRSQKLPNASINYLSWIDADSTIILQPGAFVECDEGGYNAFKFVKSTITDRLCYSASSGLERAIMGEYVGEEDARFSELIELRSLYLATGTSKIIPDPGHAVSIVGAKQVMLWIDFSGNLDTAGYFNVQHLLARTPIDTLLAYNATFPYPRCSITNPAGCGLGAKSLCYPMPEPYDGYYLAKVWTAAAVDTNCTATFFLEVIR